MLNLIYSQAHLNTATNDRLNYIVPDPDLTLWSHFSGKVQYIKKYKVHYTTICTGKYLKLTDITFPCFLNQQIIQGNRKMRCL